MWEYRGQQRPPFADIPGEGRESVWDFPRPPVLVPTERRVIVKRGEREIARSSDAYRMLETASPPTFYLPPADVDLQLLRPVSGTSHCEWKGVASYWAMADDPDGLSVAWAYANPRAPYAAMANYISFYPGLVECYVDAERVHPQPGGFYGGWVTSNVSGPFKGGPGTSHW